MNSLPRPNTSTHRVFQLVLFLFAAILIGRSIPQQSDWQWWFAKYETWKVGLPFQGRCLMVFPLHWAAHSPIMIHLSHSLAQSSLGPDNLMLQLIDVVSILGTGAIVLRLGKQLAPAPILPWLAPFLSLWAIACTYAIRYESRFYMPYDLPAVFFFSLGLLACFQGRSLLLLATFLLGTYNRETILFLLPIWLVCTWSGSKTKSWTVALAGLAVWILVKLQIRHWTHGESSGLGLTNEWRMVAFPHHWAQVASVMGFLIWPIILFRHLIADPMLKKVWLASLPLIASALLFGWWNETRIFGELIPLAAVTAAMQFEQYMRTHILATPHPQPLSNIEYGMAPGTNAEATQETYHGE